MNILLLTSALALGSNIAAGPTDIDAPRLELVNVGVSPCQAPATQTIISETPAGDAVEDLEWFSTACMPINGVASWMESNGFSPQIVVDGLKIYINAPLTTLTQIGVSAWIEGSISADGTKAVFKTPQAYMQNTTQTGGLEMLYATRINAQTGVYDPSDSDLVFEISDDGYLQTDGGLLALTNIGGGFYGYGDKDINIKKIHDVKAVPPADAAIDTYMLTSFKYGEEQRQSAHIVFQGDDVWFSDPVGIEGSWFKGVVDGDKITVPSLQYLGTGSGYPMYLTTAREITHVQNNPITGQPEQIIDYEITPQTDLVFSYDAASGAISSNQLMFVNAGKLQRGAAYAAFDKPVYTVYVPAPATPRKPVADLYIDLKQYEAYGLKGCLLGFDIYPESVDGDFIPQEDIYYQVCFDGTPLSFYDTEYLPYYAQFTDAESASAISVQGVRHQLQYGVAAKNTVSVQSFYYYDGQLIPSELASYDIVSGSIDPDPESVEEIISSDGSVVSYFDLNGRKAAPSAQGVVIRRVVSPDGSVKTDKIFNFNK